jgi:hypothetical protein
VIWKRACSWTESLVLAGWCWRRGKTWSKAVTMPGPTGRNPTTIHLSGTPAMSDGPFGVEPKILRLPNGLLVLSTGRSAQLLLLTVCGFDPHQLSSITFARCRRLGQFLWSVSMRTPLVSFGVCHILLVRSHDVMCTHTDVWSCVHNTQVDDHIHLLVCQSRVCRALDRFI